MIPNLHELANMPGFGRAAAILEKAGLRGQDPSAPQWEVTLDGTMPVSLTVLVHADSREEAIHLAGKDLHWADWDQAGSVEVHGETAFRVKEDS